MKEDKKEQTKLYHREYYRKHFAGKRVACECGSVVAKGSLNKHRQSKIHEKNMKYQHQEADLRDLGKSNIEEK